MRAAFQLRAPWATCAFFLLACGARGTVPGGNDGQWVSWRFWVVLLTVLVIIALAGHHRNHRR